MTARKKQSSEAAVREIRRRARRRFSAEEMFQVAARALAEMVEGDLAVGSIYPALTHIRDISLTIATAVAEHAYAQGVARQPRPDDVRQVIAASMYDPSY